MLFMNDYDIDQAIRRYDREDTPNLRTAALTVQRLAEWANNNSDGWAYWPKPARAARRLMELIQWAEDGPRRFDPVDIDDVDLRDALKPIKAFLTRQGVDHSEVIR